MFDKEVHENDVRKEKISKRSYSILICTLLEVILRVAWQKHGSANLDFFFRLEKSGSANSDFLVGEPEKNNINPPFFRLEKSG